MRTRRWAHGAIGFSILGLSACVGHETPLATPADLTTTSTAEGWTVSNTFIEVPREAFDAGETVIVPLKAVTKPDAERFDNRRSAYTYQVDAPDQGATTSARYLWGSTPVSNGRGNSHYLDERLAFEVRARRVSVLPRGGLANVDHEGLPATQFWCNRDALSSGTVAIVGYGPVCPTAFIRTTGDTKGPPLLVGMQKESYVIDTRFVADLITGLHLDAVVQDFRVAENASRAREKAGAAEARAQQAKDIERARTRGVRGQAMIDQGEIGSLLCTDILVGADPAVVGAFLESVHGAKVQVRVNNIRSPDGRTTFTLNAPVDGITYAPGGIVWVDRQRWRACD